MNRNFKKFFGALAITGLMSAAGAMAADREPSAVLLAQATPAPKATEQPQKPQAAGDKHSSHSDANAAADKDPDPAMETDEQDVAKQMQMMGKRMQEHGMEMEKMGKQMRERGMRMRKQGMAMETNGAPKDMNMEKMDMDMDLMEKELMDDDKDMDKMEMNMDSMDKNMGHM